jgi:hypothetical protein
LRAFCLILSLLLLASLTNASLAPQDQSIPTKIEVTQHSDPHDAWDKGITLVQNLAWPLMILIVLYLFRPSIGKVVEQLGKSGGEISIPGLGIKLPTAKGASMSEDVLTIKVADSTSIANSSAKTTLVKMLREPGTREYVVIDLGPGAEWISSRLFIFALMLQRMKSIRAIVFLDGSVGKFPGVAKPDTVRWGLAQDQPWLEQAYLNAYSNAVNSFFQNASFIVSNYGALDTAVAETVVRNYVQNVKAASPTAPAPITQEARKWAQLGNTTEFGTWLTGKDLKSLPGEGLHQETIIAASDRKTEAKLLLQCKNQYVARVGVNGEFLSLVDRVAFADELASKLVARFALLAPARAEAA